MWRNNGNAAKTIMQDPQIPACTDPAAVLHSVRTYASAGRFTRIRSKAACKQPKFRKCNFGTLD